MSRILSASCRLNSILFSSDLSRHLGSLQSFFSIVSGVSRVGLGGGGGGSKSRKFKWLVKVGVIRVYLKKIMARGFPGNKKTLDMPLIAFCRLPSFFPVSSTTFMSLFTASIHLVIFSGGFMLIICLQTCSSGRLLTKFNKCNK